MEVYVNQTLSIAIYCSVIMTHPGKTKFMTWPQSATDTEEAGVRWKKSVVVEVLLLVEFPFDSIRDDKDSSTTTTAKESMSSLESGMG